MIPLSLLGWTALAAEPTPHHSAVLVSPIGPVTALVTTATGAPAFDANLRGLHVPGRTVGVMAQADFLGADVMDIHVMHTSLKGGPRFALRQRGLEDWTLTPFASVGYTSVAAADQHLAHYSVLGLGIEAGRTWVWQRFVMEVGLGVYGAVPVAYGSPSEVLAAQDPVSVSPIKPSITWSLGYAF